MASGKAIGCPGVSYWKCRIYLLTMCAIPSQV
jgi:hypothetical protein